MEKTTAYPERNTQAYSLTIVDRDDLSLSDLAAMVEVGESVVRSPHVGNWSLYNCAVAQTGALMVAFDRNTPYKDKNYFPGYVIANRDNKDVIAKPNDPRLTTHITTTRQVGNVAAGAPLVAAHMDSLRAALPDAKIVTMSDYLNTHAAAAQEIVACLAEHGSGYDWSRRVEPDGTIRSVTGDLQDNLRQYGVFRDGTAQTKESGLLLPNAYNVLLFAVLESLDHDSDTVTHLSGPDMIKYIKGMAYDLNAIYRTVATHTSLGDRLPQHLTMQMVPTAVARFVAPSDKREALDSLLGAYEKWSGIKREGPGWEEKKLLGGLAVDAAAQKHIDPIIMPEYPAYLTQHDVLAARESQGDSGLYVPPQIWNMSFEAMGHMLERVRRMAS